MIRDPRLVAAVRAAGALAVGAGVTCLALGPSTLTGMLPYFTVQSTVAFGAVAAWSAVRAVRGDVHTRPVLKGAVTLYVTITGLVFHLLLDNPASPWAQLPVNQDALAAAGSQLLHTVVPLLAVLDFLLLDPRRRLRARHAAYWLAFPLGYLAFALLRGLVVDAYPYPFVDAARFGYPAVAVNAVVLAVVFWLLGLGLVAVDRWAPGRPAVTGAART